jgi:oxygen-independent coproporphyrinogen-3 oxidase
MFEYFFLGLRKIAGVSTVKFKERFGYEISEVYPARLRMMKEQGFLENTGENIRLTARGLMIADSVIEEFTTPEREIVERNTSSNEMNSTYL